MIYCDTSLLVSALTGEPASERVQHWLADRSPGSIAISPWVETEFVGAVARKLRSGLIGSSDQRRILEIWGVVAEECHVEPVAAHHFHDAALLLSQAGMNLRAGDALHLAIARHADHQFATLDRNLADACEVLDVPVHRFHI